MHLILGQVITSRTKIFIRIAKPTHSHKLQFQTSSLKWTLILNTKEKESDIILRGLRKFAIPTNYRNYKHNNVQGAHFK